MSGPEEPTYFRTPAALRKWLEKHHAKRDELWVGYYKKDSGKPSITWPESVDQALCFGWIDGLRRSIDDERYCIRFTQRRPRSKWSAVNLARVEELRRSGAMQPAGMAAYERRLDGIAAGYSHESAPAKLDRRYQRELRAHAAAWEYFQELAPSKRKASIHWVMSAKKEETRRRRLAVLIESSAAGQPVPPLRVSRKRS